MKTDKTYVAFSCNGTDYAFNFFDDKATRNLWADVELDSVPYRFSFSNLKQFHKRLNKIAKEWIDKYDSFEKFMILKWEYIGEYDFACVDQSEYDYKGTLRHGNKTLTEEIFGMFVISKRYQKKIKRLYSKYFNSSLNEEQAEEKCTDEIYKIIVKQFGFECDDFLCFAINEASSMREAAEEETVKSLSV